MFNYQHWASALLILLAFTLNFGLFLLPGFAIVVSFRWLRKVAPVYLVIAVVVTTATIGYGSFWLFFANRLAGKAFTYLVYGLSLLLVVRSLSKPGQEWQTARRMATPFLLASLAGICYVSFFYLFGDPGNHGAGLANVRFSEEERPGDNVIPLILAERIYNHEPLRPFCCGDWLSSDRPPLQAGIFLLEQPLRLLPIGVHYQLLATALQCLWICGAWSLLQALGASDQRIKQVIVILICSGFFFYNSVYPWPKMLAATCILFALSILLDVIRLRCPATRFQMLLAATCLGISLMSHPGSIFSLPAFGILFLRHYRLFPFRVLGLAVLIVLAFYLPWSAYQKFVDPPGNRLLKMHLAGEYAVDPRSTGQAISDAYHNHGWGELISFKWSNFRELAGHQPMDAFGFNGLHRNASLGSRIAQREWIWNALGLLNIGWLVIVGLLLRRQKYTTAVPFSGWLVVASVFDLAVWSMAMFGPNATRTTHSSYADIILLGIGLCGYLFTLPAAIVFAVFALEIWNLIVIWILFPPIAGFPRGAVVQMPFLVPGILALGILIWIFTRACLCCDPSEQGCTLS